MPESANEPAPRSSSAAAPSLTMDDAHTVLTGADVLVVDGRSPRSARRSTYPRAPVEIDASDGIVMPGMIDTHRHMWQTAMRGYGADWTLTQYFVWYYLEHGKSSAPRTSTPATCSPPARRSRPA